MYYYVYKITNLINNKIYVGKHKSSVHPLENGYYGSGKQILAAIKKYGKENFSKEVLHFCNSLEETAAKEYEIVNEDFLKRKDTYNMKLGGLGGWEHYNGSNDHKKSSGRGGKKGTKTLNDFIAEQKSNNTDWWKNWKNKVKVSNQNKNCDGWSNLSKKEKTIRKKLQSQKMTGMGNSQYGRYWITNILTKETKRLEKGETIPEGWVRGKTGHVPKKVWVNNNISEHFILTSKYEQYIIAGYLKGRLKTA